MKTKVVRIDPDAIDILHKYSIGTVSEQVRAMDRKIRDYEMSSTVSSPVSSAAIPTSSMNFIPLLDDGMTKSYWVRFKRELEAVVGTPKPAFPLQHQVKFVKATDYAKTIGKITKSESYKEPTDENGDAVQ